ncbi:hypothetical protein [Mycobacterium sp. M23085]|uniref:hypothetical protein n=1 Tax=Mycobacterium sp. M23085 TaxID=3378087 RepID=UPI003877BFE9
MSTVTVQYGITPAFADLLLSSLNGAQPTVPITCVQLHDGDPGPQGTSNVSAVGSREEMTFTSAGEGTTSLAGGVPTWAITTPDTLAAVSLWSGFDSSAICLFTLPLKPAVQVAAGDTVILGNCQLTWYEQAYSLWPPTEVVSAPSAQASAGMLGPSLSLDQALTAPTMLAACAMPQPTILEGAIIAAPTMNAVAAMLFPPIPVPLMTGNAQPFAPTTLVLTLISAPLLNATAAALAPTVGVSTTAPAMPGTAHMLTPSVSALNPVTYDAVGAGATHGGAATTTESHTLGASATAIVVLVSIYSSSGTPTVSAQIGSTTLTALGNTGLVSGVGLWLFGLINPPTGTQTVSVTVSGGATDVTAFNSVSYSNVSSFGTVQTASTPSGSSVTQTVSAAALNKVVQAFTNGTAGSGSFSAYSQTQRSNIASSGSNEALVIGDAAGAASVTFSATAPNSGSSTTAIAVPLIP